MRELELKRLKRLRKKTRPAYTYCKNCGTELKGMYCHKCGQYALDVEQPFWKYLRQYFENVYQFDSKVWPTLWLLFRRPGFLTNEFNAGKIASYVHPLRLLMFITVLFFLFLFLKLGNEVQSLQEKDMDNLTENLSEGLTDFASEMNIYGEDWYRDWPILQESATIPQPYPLSPTPPFWQSILKCLRLWNALLPLIQRMQEWTHSLSE